MCKSLVDKNTDNASALYFPRSIFFRLPSQILAYRMQYLISSLPALPCLSKYLIKTVIVQDEHT